MTYLEFRTKQKAFQSSSGSLKYIDKGQGDVVLLLHGVPTSGWLYRKMIDNLSKSYRVIVPDMLGFGSSDSPEGYDIYAPKEHAKRLLELINALGIKQWSHVFHDVGGLWTWELLKIAPQSIKHLVILNTIIYESGFKPPVKLGKSIITKFLMALYSNGISTNIMLKALFKSALLNDNIMTKEARQGYKKPLLEGKTKAMYHFFSNTKKSLPDYSNLIKSLKMPKLLIWGKEDEFLVLDKMKAQLFNDLEIAPENINIIQAKHFIQEEQPEQITELILRFLKT